MEDGDAGLESALDSDLVSDFDSDEDSDLEAGEPLAAEGLPFL